jgi:hypothetical protein
MAKKQKPKSKRITLNRKRDWNKLLKEVDTKEVPLELLNSINIKLIDGTDISIDVPSMLKGAKDSAIVEEYLNNKFEELDSYILNVDFFIDIDSVSQEVQASTDEVLKNLP